MNLRLGRIPAEINAEHPSLMGASLIRDRIAPPRLIRGHIDPKPALGENDQIGDCTAAGLVNSARCVAALNGFDISTPDSSIVQFYSQSTGYVPGQPNTDQGGVEADVLTYAVRNGLALRTQSLTPVWGTIDPMDFNALRLVCAAFGSTYLGVNLAVADEANIGGVWDIPTRPDEGDGTPGSWGGHCLLLWSYDGVDDSDTITLLTWGKEQKATWRWLRSRLEEAHAILWPQLATPLPGFMSVDCMENLKADNARFLNGNSA